MNRRSMTGVAVTVVLLFTGCSSQFWELKPEVSAKAEMVLREGLNSGEFWPSMHAAEALTIAGFGSEVRAVLEPKLTREQDDQRRCGLARELVRAGDEKRAEVLIDILGGDDPHGHVHAAESLFKVGWPSKSAPVRAAFDQNENTILRLMAAAALAKHSYADDQTAALVFLRETMVSAEASDDFRIAAWVLARVGDSSDVARIRARLSDTDDERVRSFLDHASAVLGDPAGRAALRSNLNSPTPAIRTYAATFAGEAAVFEATPQLIQLLDDENLDTRIRAAQALFTLRKIYSR
jgi:sialidase-1